MSGHIKGRQAAAATRYPLFALAALAFGLALLLWQPTVARADALCAGQSLQYSGGVASATQVWYFCGDENELREFRFQPSVSVGCISPLVCGGHFYVFGSLAQPVVFAPMPVFGHDLIPFGFSPLTYCTGTNGC